MDSYSENIKRIQVECQSANTSNNRIEQDVDLFVENVAVPVFQNYLSNQNKGNEKICLKRAEDPYNNLTEFFHRSNLVDENECSMDSSDVGIQASDHLEVILEVPDTADQIEYQPDNFIKDNGENGSSSYIKQEITEQELKTSEFLKNAYESKCKFSYCPVQEISKSMKKIYGNKNKQLIVSDKYQSDYQMESLIMNVKCEHDLIDWSAEEINEEETKTCKNTEEVPVFQKVNKIKCQVEKSCSKRGNSNCELTETSKLAKKISENDIFHQSEYIDSFIGEIYIKTENKRSLVHGTKRSEEGIVNDYFSKKNPPVMLEKSSVTEEKLLVYDCHELGMINTFSCEKCSICFGTEKVLKTHINEVHGMNNFVCDKCNKTFKSNNILENHKRIHTSDVKFVCQLCNKSFLWKNSFIMHCLAHAEEPKEKNYGEKMIIQDSNLNAIKKTGDHLNQHRYMKQQNLPVNLHKGNEDFKCPTCSDHFSTQTLLDEHMQVVHDGCNFKCKACGKFCSSKKYLNQHMQVHTGMGELKCPICIKCLVTKSALKKHIITVHCGLRYFSCDECDKSFKSRDSLNEHKQMHGGIKKFVCEMCNKCYISKSKLKKHLSAHVLKLKENKIHFKCRECDKEFSSKSYLSKHLEAHADINKCRCPYCSKFFATDLVLKLHIKTVHFGEGNFACNECGKTFSSSWYLSEHKQTHGGIKKYICDLCNNMFVSKYQLRNHHRNHDNKFKCRTCGLKSSTKEDLVQHLKIHAGMMKTFRCEKCCKCFVRKYDLQRHLQEIHGTNSFVCDECSKVFKSIWKLNNHKKIHTGDKKWVCQICSKSFLWKSKLIRHYLTHSEKPNVKCFGENFYSKDLISPNLNLHAMEQIDQP